MKRQERTTLQVCLRASCLLHFLSSAIIIPSSSTTSQAIQKSFNYTQSLASAILTSWNVNILHAHFNEIEVSANQTPTCSYPFLSYCQSVARMAGNDKVIRKNIFKRMIAIIKRAWANRFRYKEENLPEEENISEEENMSEEGKRGRSPYARRNRLKSIDERSESSSMISHIPPTSSARC